jgi:hypothetical protein
MKLSPGVWIGNPFSDHIHQRPMVELNANEQAGSWILHSTVEGYLDLDTRLFPPCIYIQPLPISVI